MFVIPIWVSGENLKFCERSTEPLNVLPCQHTSAGSSSAHFPSGSFFSNHAVFTVSLPRSQLPWVSEGVKSLSHVRLFATPCTMARQAPLSMGFSRQEDWSGLPFPSLLPWGFVMFVLSAWSALPPGILRFQFSGPQGSAQSSLSWWPHRLIYTTLDIQYFLHLFPGFLFSAWYLLPCNVCLFVSVCLLRLIYKLWGTVPPPTPSYLLLCLQCSVKLSEWMDLYPVLLKGSFQ